MSIFFGQKRGSKVIMSKKIGRNHIAKVIQYKKLDFLIESDAHCVEICYNAGSALFSSIAERKISAHSLACSQILSVAMDEREKGIALGQQEVFMDPILFLMVIQTMIMLTCLYK